VTVPLDAGYAALGSAAVVELDRDVVRIAGPDAVSFLQGQLSQDVAALPVGASAWTLLLQPQGRVDAWGRITRRGGDEVLFDTDGGWGAVVLARLQRFKLRVKADLELLDWRCVAVRGPQAGERLAAASRGADVVAAAAWPWVGGLDLLGPAPVAPPELPIAGLDAYELRRIEAGLPRMGAELTERTIPAEAGLVEVSASFTKGCYTGQELVARIDSRGSHVARHLRGLWIDGPVPAPGATLVVDGREQGTVTSSAFHPDGHAVALAYVHRDVDPTAALLCDGSPAGLVVLPAPADPAAVPAARFGRS